MSYDAEREAIEAYFIENWSEGPVGPDGHVFTPSENAVRLTIQSGQPMVKSVGRPGTNRVRHPGVLQLELYVPSGVGSSNWRVQAQTIESLFTNIDLDDTGELSTTNEDVFLRFGRFGMIPYISSVLREPPWTRVTINAPFTRDENKG